MTSNLAWADFETGGLCGTTHAEDSRIPVGKDGAEHYAILQIAIHVTDCNLNIIDEGLDLIIFHDQHVLDERVGPWSRNQFAKSLMKSCLYTINPTLSEAEDQVIDYLKRYGIQKGASPLCGNSIYLDRRFMESQMRKLNDFMHYRQLDVSSVGEVMSRLYPDTFQKRPKKVASHDALTDIRESIEELRFYHTHCMK
jgi:oligoribonuclease